MHEWALAEGVVTTALEISDKEGMRQISRIVVRIGELQRIQPEVFRQALDAVKPPGEQRLAATEFELEVQPVRFRCRACEHDFGLSDADGGLKADDLEAIHFIPELAHTYMRCPGCGSPDFEVRQGRGVWLASMEGES